MLPREAQCAEGSSAVGVGAATCIHFFFPGRYSKRFIQFLLSDYTKILFSHIFCPQSLQDRINLTTATLVPGTLISG
jgi:hypothetical protein